VQGKIHDGLDLLAASENPDEGIDVLGPDFHWPIASSLGNEVLPGERHRIIW
jgi:hypothetical protein